MSNIRFIGGPWDGRIVPVADACHIVDVPLPLERLHIVAEGCVELPKVETKVVRYKRMLFAGETKRFELFVTNGMTGDIAMEMLIARYQGEHHD